MYVAEFGEHHEFLNGDNLYVEQRGLVKKRTVVNIIWYGGLINMSTPACLKPVILGFERLKLLNT